MKEAIISDLLACKVAFDTLKLPWVVNDGIVLGYVREGDVIAWDTDVDTGIYVEISPEERQRLVLALWNVGFSISSVDTDFMCAQRRVKFNLVLYHKKGDFYEQFPGTTPGVKFVEKAEWYDEPQMVKFLGSEYPMPNHLEDYLDHHYGTDWKVERFTHDAWRLEKFGTSSNRYEPDAWLNSRCGPNGDLWPKIIKREDTV